MCAVVSHPRIPRQAAGRGLPDEADAVFEGGGVKGIALVGGLRAAEDAGVKKWKNVAGTSAGAIVACLVAAGYDSRSLEAVLRPLHYADFADYGWPGKLRGVLWKQFRMRGLAPGRFFEVWLTQRLAESPLAKKLGVDELRFEHLVRDDLPAGLTDDERLRARYRLQVIASDVTGGRMLVLPHDIERFSLTRNGPKLTADELPLVKAVRMSMSYPYLFAPVTLWADDGPHSVVDRGLLSNFPIWLFDASPSRKPARPTWGFRLHGGSSPDEPPAHRQITMPLWRIPLLKAMFEAATGAWDLEQLEHGSRTRTVSIPTGSISTTDFELEREEAEELFNRGHARAQTFFANVIWP